MISDSRVSYVKHLIETHQLNHLEDILLHYPKTPFGKHFGKNSKRAEEFVQNEHWVNVEKIFEIAEVFGVDPDHIWRISKNQYNNHKKTKKKSAKK